MSFQSTNIWSRGLSYTWEALFGIVCFCGLILVIGLVNQIMKIYKKDTIYKINKITISFFIVSPILVTTLLLSELFWRIDAFYGVSTYYVSYWYEYFIFTLFNFLTIVGIWIIKNIFTKGFPEYKKEVIQMKNSFISFNKKVFNIFTKFKNPNNLLNNKKQDEILDKVFSPSKGRVIALDKVKDEAFSQKLLGDGFAIVPSVTDGKFKAPVNGTIETIFHTKHAYGIKTKNGTSVLVHIGLNTVNLKGKYFESFKKVGDEVKVGDIIIEADLRNIKSKGYDITTMVVCTPETKGNVEILSDNFNQKDKTEDGLIKIS